MKTIVAVCLTAGLLLLGASLPPSVNDGYGDYVLIPAGAFKMGDNFNDGDARERPVHTVDLDAYYIGKYPLTNGEFRKFFDDPGYDTPAFWPDGKATPKTQSTVLSGSLTRAGRENFPVAAVTWDQATAYCKWLSAKTGKQYRLPTEAEWEKAARGTTQRRYPWGNDIDPSYASYQEKPMNAVGFYDGSLRGAVQTHRNASPYGVFDMEGSVFEWCSDWYSPNYYAFSPAKNPQGPPEGAYRVVRGASQYEEPWELRAANRSSGAPSNQNHHFLGFRPVRGI